MMQGKVGDYSVIVTIIVLKHLPLRERDSGNQRGLLSAKQVVSQSSCWGGPPAGTGLSSFLSQSISQSMGETLSNPYKGSGHVLGAAAVAPGMCGLGASGSPGSGVQKASGDLGQVLLFDGAPALSFGKNSDRGQEGTV